MLEIAKIVHAADVASDIDIAPEAHGVEAIAAGSMYLVEDDYEALEKEFYVYDALYAYVQVKSIQDEYQSELSKLDRSERFNFIKARITKPPEVKVKRPVT